MAKKAKLKDKELKFLLYWAISEGMDGSEIEDIFVDFKALQSLDTTLGNLSMKAPPNIRPHIPVLCSIILNHDKAQLPYEAAADKLEKILTDDFKKYLATLKKKAKLLNEFKSRVFNHKDNVLKNFPIIRKYLRENKC